ncbi:MAG: hypothetical protein IJ530_15905 [Treponema sp.]|uniref:hypothetical protein n=1 Tax=Treponema sp. TaxID=166 RepID=UPI002600D560|nr:hypothetical protein [Treponema sp.]MBQ8681217.1 hypothetical protein [Treponema sp.]MBR1403119.1 hypothetical protein [Treponema sp.]
MENTIKDIISKPVGETYEYVQTLGIYCWQEEINHQDAAFFMPRFSFQSNKEYLEKLYKGISNDSSLSNQGIFASVWKIAKVYYKVPVDAPESVLSNDITTLSAFKAWCKFAAKPENKKLNVYVLSEEKHFAQYKHTELQNPSGITYYDWEEVLKNQVIKGK